MLIIFRFEIKLVLTGSNIFEHKIAIVFLLSLAGVNAQEKQNKFKDSFKASLVVTSDFSYEFNSESLQKSEIIFKPEFSYRLNKNSKFVLKGQLYTELNDNLEAGVPKEHTVSNMSKRLFIGNRTNLELREFYYYTNINSFKNGFEGYDSQRQSN